MMRSRSFSKPPKRSFPGFQLNMDLPAGSRFYDDFAASMNDPEAVDVACRVMKALGIQFGDRGVPMRASEDFGAFGWTAKAAMLCLGPGKTRCSAPARI